MGWIIVGCLAMLIAAVVAHFAWRSHRWRRFKEAERRTAEKLGLGKRLDRIDATPDRPRPFGYKMAWLAIPASDPLEVAHHLGVLNVEPANWRTGIWAAYEGRLFVTPPVKGWILVVSYKLPSLGERNEAECVAILQLLSQRYKEAQCFATHRVGEYHAWARFVNGEETRAYAYVGESGKTLVDRGRKSAAEVELGYEYFDERSPLANADEYWEREDLCYPDEQHVMEVAGKWSLNPTLLDENEAPPAAGWVGDYEPPGTSSR